jgi:transcriptional regulator GlxA family with amidase domain
MSSDGTPRTSSSGVAVDVDSGLPQDLTSFDYIAVCGGNDYPNKSIPKPLCDWLRKTAAERVHLLGVCTGSFALAHAGLIETRTVCVHWNVLNDFRSRFPEIRVVVDRLFVDEGDLITCAGSTAAIDLGLYLVARHCGRSKAHQAMRHMMLHGMRPARLPQAHFYADLSGIQDVRVRQAAHYLEQRLDDPPTLDATARYVGIGRRQLERAFNLALNMSPMAFQRNLRLKYASWMLLNHPRPITEVALDCGFSDGAHFSREFRAEFGVSPRQYQKRGLVNTTEA